MLIKYKNKLDDISNYYNLIWKKKNRFRIGFLRSMYMKIMGFTSDQYTLYSLRTEDISEYVSEKERWYTRRINGIYTIALDDKLLFYDLFKNDINIPENIIRIQNGLLLNSEGNVIKENDLSNIIIESESLYFKPIIGGGGKGVFKVDYIEGDFLYNGNHISFQDLYILIKKSDMFIANKAIRQIGFINKIFPQSVNTLRIVTAFDDSKGEVEILTAMHRFGTQKSVPVDNASRGGIFSMINLNNGEMSFAKDYNNKVYKTHPDSNMAIEGIKIPNWEKIKDYCSEVALKFSYIPYMAWDIVLSDDKISIIEINASTDLLLIQMFGGVRNTKMGDFFRRHGCIE